MTKLVSSSAESMLEDEGGRHQDVFPVLRGPLLERNFLGLIINEFNKYILGTRCVSEIVLVQEIKQ